MATIFVVTTEIGAEFTHLKRIRSNAMGVASVYLPDTLGGCPRGGYRTNPLTMSTRKIAELTGKEHKNVMRDFRDVCEVLEITAPSFGASYIDSTGDDTEMLDGIKKTRWAIPEKLRAKIDAVEYKHLVLNLNFVSTSTHLTCRMQQWSRFWGKRMRLGEIGLAISDWNPLLAYSHLCVPPKQRQFCRQRA